MSNPTFSQFQRNIQRQSTEQRAVGSLLSGIAIALVAAILIVAALAGYGGWILSRQIQQQSVTMAQLEAKLTGEIQTLQGGLRETASTVETLSAQTQAQKQQIGWLQNQFEDVRAQHKKDRAATQFALQKLERRLYDLERIEAQRR